MYRRAGQCLLPRAALLRAERDGAAGGGQQAGVQGRGVTAGSVPAGRGGCRGSAGGAEAPSHGTERRGQAAAGLSGKVLAGRQGFMGDGPTAASSSTGSPGWEGRADSTPGGTDGRTERGGSAPLIWALQGRAARLLVNQPRAERAPA